MSATREPVSFAVPVEDDTDDVVRAIHIDTGHTLDRPWFVEMWCEDRDGNGPSAYMPPDLARQIGHALINHANLCDEGKADG